MSGGVPGADGSPPPPPRKRGRPPKSVGGRQHRVEASAAGAMGGGGRGAGGTGGGIKAVDYDAAAGEAEGRLSCRDWSQVCRAACMEVIFTLTRNRKLSKLNPPPPKP
jgi:hypothetical protein